MCHYPGTFTGSAISWLTLSNSVALLHVFIHTRTKITDPHVVVLFTLEMRGLTCLKLAC
jgi:hypothetical protein